MTAQQAKEGITVALCCYNSVLRLPETLKHIAGQVVHGDLNWEVLIVDNLSSDNTATAAQEIWTRLGGPVPLRVVNEKLSGLSNARRKAVYEARYEFILFCDDDNWLDEHYVQRSFELMNSDSAVGILGGLGIPEFEITPPTWFDDFSGSYAVGPQSSATGYLGNSRNIYGAGMTLRGSVLKQLYEKGFTSILTGRHGANLSTGEDIEICLWYRAMGYKLYYDDALTFRHFIPAHRLTKEFFLKRTEGKGKTEAVFLIYKTLMNGAERIPWLDSKVLWHYELVKRLVYFLGAWLRSVSGFRAKVEGEFLLSSIKYRVNNYETLKACAKQVGIYTAIMKEYGILSRSAGYQ